MILETKKIKSVTASTFSPSMGMRVGQLKNRDIPLLTKVHIVKAVVFSVVMDRCERFSLYCLLISKLHISQRRCFILKFPVSRYIERKAEIGFNSHEIITIIKHLLTG